MAKRSSLSKTSWSCLFWPLHSYIYPPRVLFNKVVRAKGLTHSLKDTFIRLISLPFHSLRNVLCMTDVDIAMKVHVPNGWRGNMAMQAATSDWGGMMAWVGVGVNHRPVSKKPAGLNAYITGLMLAGFPPDIFAIQRGSRKTDFSPPPSVTWRQKNLSSDRPPSTTQLRRQTHWQRRTCETHVNSH